MEFNKHILPFLVAGAVGATYYFSRGNDGTKGATVPNPASGGVTGASTGPAPDGTNSVQGADYTAQQTLLNPSINSALANLFSAYPGNANAPDTPGYLSFNFGPGWDVTKQAAPFVNDNSAGNVFVDGPGDTLLSSSKARLISSDTNWIGRAAQNIIGYLEGDQSSPTPTLTSLMPSGALEELN